MTFKEIADRITVQHVREAFAEIDKHGIPPNRRSTKWCIQAGDHRYPPKYVLAIAAKLATGHQLSPSAHGGGKQTNRILEKLGFRVIPCTDGSDTMEK
jgi:hypothetical protein